MAKWSAKTVLNAPFLSQLLSPFSSTHFRLAGLNTGESQGGGDRPVRWNLPPAGRSVWPPLQPWALPVQLQSPTNIRCFILTPDRGLLISQGPEGLGFLETEQRYLCAEGPWHARLCSLSPSPLHPVPLSRPSLPRVSLLLVAPTELSRRRADPQEEPPVGHGQAGAADSPAFGPAPRFFRALVLHLRELWSL